MKVTETTLPPVKPERTFTVEMTESELRRLRELSTDEIVFSAGSYFGNGSAMSAARQRNVERQHIRALIDAALTEKPTALLQREYLVRAGVGFVDPFWRVIR